MCLERVALCFRSRRPRPRAKDCKAGRDALTAKSLPMISARIQSAIKLASMHNAHSRLIGATAVIPLETSLLWPGVGELARGSHA